MAATYSFQVARFVRMTKCKMHFKMSLFCFYFATYLTNILLVCDFILNGVDLAFTATVSHRKLNDDIHYLHNQLQLVYLDASIKLKPEIEKPQEMMVMNESVETDRK